MNQAICNSIIWVQEVGMSVYYWGQGLKNTQSPAARPGTLARGTTGILPGDTMGPRVYPSKRREPFPRSEPEPRSLLRSAHRHSAARERSSHNRYLAMSRLNSSNVYSRRNPAPAPGGRPLAHPPPPSARRSPAAFPSCAPASLRRGEGRRRPPRRPHHRPGRRAVRGRPGAEAPLG